ncbi:MAG: hypothetical protein EZS28_022421 [Streblomastix strix]|uniref:RNase H type-1 domain-containing protein n=1 Tax=Streblomastix strix TaxID=222440 RepID=A0A5J4VIF6_9EUKA|nr:MAG: hypothetical protein EZS28_022421 [Streblomastix strix]
MNKAKADRVNNGNWNSRVRLNRQMLKEIYWWKTRIQCNQPIRATIQTPEACLTTDDSTKGWGASLLINFTQQEILFHGNWTDKWRLTSSNQRETAAVLIGLRCSQQYLLQNNIRALRIQTDSSTSAYNINRGAATVPLRKLADKILKEPKILHLQVSAVHISGKTNTVADSLSRLASSGDYTYLLIGEIGNVEDSLVLNLTPGQRITMDFEYLGKENSPFFIHQPQQFPQCYKKPHRRKFKPQQLHPFWPSQPWWPTLIAMTSRQLILGKSQEIFHPGDKMRKQQQHLPTCQMIITVIGETEEKDFLNGFEFWNREGNKWTDLLQVSDPEAVISNFVAQLKADDATNSNINNCKIAISMLFNMQGFSEEKINGQALKQIMKQPSSAMRKEHKEEPIYELDILIKHLQSKAQRLDQLPEMEFMGCVISSIMALTTLRLAEVHRATATPLPDGAWQLHTTISKTKIPKATI